METIKIYDTIDPMWGYGLADLEADLRNAGGEDIHVKIQSGGGSVFEGLAIYNTLKNYEGQVTTEIVGLSASIASVIFLAGDKRIVNEAGFLMIHEAWTMTAGGASDLREDAELLDQINAQILDIYQRVTGMDREVLAEKMSKDTYMGAEELMELGFVTEVNEGVKLVASINKFTNKQLKKEPQQMAEQEKTQVESLEAQNKEIEAKLAEKDAKMAELSAEIEALKASQEEAIKAGIEAEKQRESEILNSCLHEKQAEFAKELVAKGESVVNAKLALMDNFKANQGEYMKVDPVAVLEAEAPQASKGEAQTETRESIYAEIKQLKAQGDFAGADKLYNKLSEVK